MVSAIRFWMKAFNVLDSKDCITEFGERMFSSNGYDPYLEDEASLWLLHYQLVKTGYASTYNIVFNQFRKEKLFLIEMFLSIISNAKRKLNPEFLLMKIHCRRIFPYSSKCIKLI